MEWSIFSNDELTTTNDDEVNDGPPSALCLLVAGSGVLCGGLMHGWRSGGCGSCVCGQRVGWRMKVSVRSRLFLLRPYCHLGDLWLADDTNDLAVH
jgi:hypothetical protein